VAERVVVGVIRRTRGVRGELVVESQSDIPDRFSNLKHVYLVTAAGARPVTITGVKYVREEVWITLAEITQREEAQALRGATLEIEIEQRPKLPEGEYYYDELEGMEVYDTENRRLGTITTVYPRGGQDVYGVETEHGEALIPADSGIVKRVDMASRKMFIDPPAGLLPGDDAD